MAVGGAYADSCVLFNFLGLRAEQLGDPECECEILAALVCVSMHGGGR